MKRVLGFVVIMTLACRAACADAQQNVPSSDAPTTAAPSTPAPVHAEAKAEPGTGSPYANALDIVLPKPPDEAQLASRAATMYVNGLTHYYAYYASALEHRRDIFAWQLVSSQITFAIVIFLVISGVFFAGWQFFRDRSSEVSTIEASPQGIKVSSHVLGIIVLTISLIFFYLYLVYIYPIHESITMTGR